MGNSVKSKVNPIVAVDIYQVVDAMMPLYYTKQPPTEAHISLATKTWALITKGLSPGLCDLRQQHGFEMMSFSPDEGTIIFRKEFARRFFDIYPTAKAMFSEDQQENQWWSLSIADLCINQLRDPKAFRKRMVALTKAHIERGVCAVQYGNIGEIFFWTLNRCLGTMWGYEIEEAWKVLFSTLLRIMVPLAVHFEVMVDCVQVQDQLQLSKETLARSRCSDNSAIEDISRSFATIAEEQSSVIDENERLMGSDHLDALTPGNPTTPMNSIMSNSVNI